jgi:hypothetical protein
MTILEYYNILQLLKSDSTFVDINNFIKTKFDELSNKLLDNNITKSNIKSSISNYNIFMKRQILNVLESTNDTLSFDEIVSMLILRFISSEILVFSESPNNKYSSIGPGLMEIMKNHEDYYFDISDVDNITQIMGHKPISCASSYFKYKKQCYINVDTSNSFTSSIYTKQDCSSNNRIILKSDSLELHSTINFNIDNIQILNDNFQDLLSQLLEINPIKKLIYTTMPLEKIKSIKIICDNNIMNMYNSYILNGYYFFIHGKLEGEEKYLVSMVK